MSAGAPWSVKGIDPKAREIAKDLARRSGMTLGEWLNQMIMEDGEDDPVVTPLGRRPQPHLGADRRGRFRRLDDAYEDDLEPARDQRPAPRAHDDLSRVTRALDDLTARLEGAENRSTLAISGVDQAVAGLLARLESNEHDQSATSVRLEHVAEDLRDEHGRVLDRIRQIEREGANPRHTDALKALETALGKIANQIYERDARTRASLTETKEALSAVTRRVDRVESRTDGPDAALLVDGVVARISERLEQAESRTAGAIRALESSFTHLDQRLRTAEGRIEAEPANPFEKLAEDLSNQVDAARAEMISRFDQMGAARFDHIEQALEDLSVHIGAAEQSSARAIEKMGQEVVRIAQNLNGRMTGVEQSSAQAMTHAQGEMSRMAHAVESRLRKADESQAQGLERLGGEIARISERLSERIAHAERRSALHADDMGERIGRLADKMESRYDKASGEIGERIRQSEERTALLLEQARETLDRSLSRAEHRAANLAATVESGSRLEAADPWAASAPAPSYSDPAPAAEDDRDPRSIFDEPAPAFPSFSDFGAPRPAPPESLAESFAEPFSAPAAAAAEPSFDDFFGGTREAAAPLGSTPLSHVALPDPLVNSLDEDFNAETEFLSPGEMRAAPRPPVSTKEAIDAARAAARLGVRNSAPDDRGGLFGGLKGAGSGAGKTRLQERIDRESKRDSSTVKKALLASGVAMILTSGLVGGYLYLGDGSAGKTPGAGLTAIPRDLFKAASDPAAATPLAAVAMAQAPSLSGAEKAKAESLYQDAVDKLSNHRAGGLEPLTQAANLGYPPAQFFLASLYTAGDSGVAKDKVQARVWTERAAQGGDRKAMFNLGMFYFDGDGGPKDAVMAAKWFRKAADLGLIDSQYNLARLYEQGAGVPKDLGEAYKWYLIAARSGDEESRAGAEQLRDQIPADQREGARAAAQAFKATDGDAAGATGH